MDARRERKQVIVVTILLGLIFGGFYLLLQKASSENGEFGGMPSSSPLLVSSSREGSLQSDETALKRKKPKPRVGLIVASENPTTFRLMEFSADGISTGVLERGDILSIMGRDKNWEYRTLIKKTRLWEDGIPERGTYKYRILIDWKQWLKLCRYTELRPALRGMHEAG